MPRQKSRTLLIAALGALTLGFAACDDAYWVIAQGKKGSPPGSPGGPTGTGGAGACTPGTGGTTSPPACTSDVLGGADVCLDVASWKQNAYLACQKAGLNLSDYSPFQECGKGNYQFVKYLCCPDVAPPPPPPPTQCTTQSQGSPTSCKDVGTWKSYAYESCAAAGGSLTAYSPYESCGDGLYRYVKYECCSPTTPPPPPPPPPPTQCTTQSQGSPTSCKDVATWKSYAYESCAAAGGSLTAYSPYEACGDGLYRYVKYECCAPTPPPPPPPPTQCTTQSQGSPTSCKDVATWKSYASQSCAAAGGSLTAYSPYEQCGDGLYRYVKYECCANPATPPPPSGPYVDPKLGEQVKGPGRFAQFKCCPSATGCDVEVLGDKTTCLDAATWQSKAVDRCATKGQMLAPESLGIFTGC